MMPWYEITSPSQIDAELTRPGRGGFTLILKHSGRCALSAVAKSRLEKHADPRINYCIIDVINHRDTSRELEARTGVKHESPQAFLFEGDRLIEVKSHLAISALEFGRRLDLIAEI